MIFIYRTMMKGEEIPMASIKLLFSKGEKQRTKVGFSKYISQGRDTTKSNLSVSAL